MTEGQRWRCFVCGEQLNEYVEYRTHIYNEHEAGREFVSCPACQAPVRDLKSHYAAKHPHRILPKNQQMRAVVWYDFKTGKKKTRKPKFKEGFFQSAKNGKNLHYRSGYECEVYELLEKDIDVMSYHVEPYKVPYLYKGEWRDYVPDLRVNFIDGKVEIWEIKPATQTKLEQNQQKWKATRIYTENLGWEFRVITESEIQKLRSKVRGRQLG